MSHRNNSFDFARLLGAFMVLYSHSFAVAGLPEPVVAGMWSFGSLGVFIFFSISGYLITLSWKGDPNVFRFLLRRSLRIFPGLAVMVFLTVFVLGPLVSSLSASAYFQHPATYQYLKTMALHIHYYLPGCFEQAPM